MANLTPSALVVSLAALIITAYYVYRATIPKVIPGIPCVKATSTRPFGDLPDFLKHLEKENSFNSFILRRSNQLNSPVFQMFVKPFRLPWVIVADARE